jgi:hypothetical protein
MEGGIYYYYDYYFLWDAQDRIELAHRVCGFLNMQLSIKVKFKLIYWGVYMKPL